MNGEILIEIRFRNELIVYEYSTFSKITHKVMSLISVYIYTSKGP